MLNRKAQNEILYYHLDLIIYKFVTVAYNALKYVCHMA